MIEPLAKDQVEGLFKAAQIRVISIEELANQYWPRVEKYQELRETNPWWLVQTEFGPVKIGPRKRVLHIEWTETPIRMIATTRDVTKDMTCVHAYELTHALEALQAWGQHAHAWAAAQVRALLNANYPIDLLRLSAHLMLPAVAADIEKYEDVEARPGA